MKNTKWYGVLASFIFLLGALPSFAQSSCRWQDNTLICCDGNGCNYCTYNSDGTPTQCGNLSARKEVKLASITHSIPFSLPKAPSLQCGGAGTCDPPPQPTLQVNCPPAQLLINVPGQVKVDWGPCVYTFPAGTVATPLVGSASSDVILTQPISTKLIESWIGTNASSFGVEVGVDVTFTLPDGRIRYLANEFDKHQDVVGEQWRQWYLNFNLPAGTILHFHVVAGVTNSALDCPLGCAHETVLLLEDELK